MCTHCNWAEYSSSQYRPQAASPPTLPLFSQTFPAGLNASGSMPDPGDSKRAQPTNQDTRGDFQVTLHQTWLKRRQVEGREGP